jgi:hypothetical protein
MKLIILLPRHGNRCHNSAPRRSCRQFTLSSGKLEIANSINNDKSALGFAQFHYYSMSDCLSDGRHMELKKAKSVRFLQAGIRFRCFSLPILLDDVGR